MIVVIVTYLGFLLPLLLGLFSIGKWIKAKKSFKYILQSLGITPFKGLNLFVGLVIGTVAFTLLFLIYYLLNFLVVKSISLNFQILTVALHLLGLVIFEEIVSRSFFINGLKLFIKSEYLIILITAIFFSFAHLLNNGATFISSISTVIGGIMYAYAFIKTKNIWLPIGLHFSWNFVQGVIYGFNVSGYSFNSILTIKVEENSLWLGGSYGPEGGLIGIIARIFVIVMLWLFIKRYKKTSNNASM